MSNVKDCIRSKNGHSNMNASFDLGGGPEPPYFSKTIP